MLDGRGPYDCARVLELLEAYVDQELPPPEAQALEAHVLGSGGPGGVGCWECQRRLRAARRLQRALRSLPTISCPEEVVERALAELRADPEGVADEAREHGASARAVPELQLVRSGATERHEETAGAASPDRGSADVSAKAHAVLWTWLGVAAAVLLSVAGALVFWSSPSETGRVHRVDTLQTAQPLPSGLQQQAIAQDLSDEEVVEALEQARLALAVVASVSRRSALLIRDQVMVGEVLQPTAHALALALDPVTSSTSKLLYGDDATERGNG